ncbi:MAG: NAD(P)/FAD-dependent oxidoreductase [Cyanophyceae cyanobacterium]
MTKPTVILGAGFAGLFTALHLCHRRYPRPVILIDRAERFVFKPLLYELLSVEMTTDQVSPRFEELLTCSGIAYVQDRVTEIDLPKHEVKLASGLCYSYSNLVLALGSTANYFHTEGAAEHSMPFRSSEDAQQLKQHLRNCLQRASQTQSESERRALLTVAVVGAGPAGVEMALTLADLLPQWYAKLGGNAQEIRIVILNRSQEILKGDINSHLRETAVRAMQRRTVAVELEFKAAVKAVSPEWVAYEQNGQRQQLPCATTIWTAGNTVNPLIEELPVSQDRRDRTGRLQVTPTLQLPDFPEVFAAGDCAYCDAHLPATAQVAYQQGAAIAHNLAALAKGKPLKPASVHLRGTLMKLGLGEGAANLFDRLIVSGQVGHLIRQGTYLELLPNSVHNFKATTQWLTDELFNHHQTAKKNTAVGQWLGSGVAILVLMSTGLLALKLAQPDTFDEMLQATGLATLLQLKDVEEE